MEWIALIVVVLAVFLLRKRRKKMSINIAGREFIDVSALPSTQTRTLTGNSASIVGFADNEIAVQATIRSVSFTAHPTSVNAELRVFPPTPALALNAFATTVVGTVATVNTNITVSTAVMTLAPGNTTIPATATGKKWNPGHYIKTQGAHTNPDQTNYWAGVNSTINGKVEDIPEVLGATAAIAAGRINPAAGVYFFDDLDDVLANLKARGNRRLIIEVPWKNFNGEPQGLITPGDLTGEAITTNSPGWIWAVWRESNMDRLIEIMEAIANRYDSDPNVELVTGAESGASLGQGHDQQDFTHSKMATQLLRLNAACATAFKQTLWMPILNSLGGSTIDPIIEDCYLKKIGFNSADFPRGRAVRVFRNDSDLSPAATFNRDYRGTIGQHQIVSGSALNVNTTIGDGESPNSHTSAAGILQDNFAPSDRTQQCSHLSWVTTRPSPFTWTQIKAAIQAAPTAIHNVCPTQYDACQPRIFTVRKDGAGTDLTIASALSRRLLPGDIIEVQAPTAGGSEIFDELIQPVDSGTDGSEIILRVREGDTVRLQRTSNDDLFVFDNIQYWKIIGTGGTLIIGDSDLTWSNTGDDNTSGGRGVGTNRLYLFTNGTAFIDVVDCDGWGGSGSSQADSHGSFFDDTCHHLRWKGGSWGLMGTNNDPHPNNVGNDRGDVFQSRADQVILDNVDMHEGGHDLFIMHGNDCVIRNCDLDQNWTSRATGFPGARAGSISTARTDRGSDAPFGPCLLEGNTFRNFNASVDKAQQNAHKLAGSDPIVRGNFYWDGSGAMFSTAPAGDGTFVDNGVERNWVYNNTGYNVGGVSRVRDSNRVTTLKLCRENTILNNIFDQTLGEVAGESVDWWQDVPAYDRQGHPDDWFGNIFDGNIFQAASGPVKIKIEPDATLYDIAGIEVAFPFVWLTNTEEAVTFVSAPTRSKAGFALTPLSPGYRTAVPHAKLVSTALGATTLLMNRVGWIWDAPNLEYFDEEPDFIKIVPVGQDPRTSGTEVQVVRGSKNITGNTIEVVSPVTAVILSEVWWVQVLEDGTHVVADNKGANQN